MNNMSYQVCTRCLMDTTDPEITFNELGQCNNCTSYLERAAIRLIAPEKRDEELQKLINTIKEKGKGKEYDCIIGVSGGTDSTYVAYKVKELGLRPIAIHLDNGWNSELAVKNIENTLTKLNIPLFTHVIDWEEFRDIQLSFLYASTPDMEIPTDHAINALLFNQAAKFGIEYIISGSNFNDEGAFPESWAYGHLDWKYISGIHNKFGKHKIKTFPHLPLPKLMYYTLVKRIKTIAILNYMHFEKTEARKILTEKLDWVDYGGKHNESLYTKFIQEYVLPKKFNIDVRKPYYSGPVLRSQMTREHALEMLQQPIATEKSLADQKEYMMKKLELSENDFNSIMTAPLKKNSDYPSNKKTFARLRNLLNMARKKGLAHS